MKSISLVEVTSFLSAKLGFEILADPGRIYIRLCYKRNRQYYAYCFLDFEGNIYKAANWSYPAKHVRGSIFDPDMSWGNALLPSGARRLRK